MLLFFFFFLKVNEWAEGKRGNIRALLCSLHKVLWDGEKRWEPCGMHNLVQPDQVRWPPTYFPETFPVSCRARSDPSIDEERLDRRTF